jgi:hypothetical protein
VGLANLGSESETCVGSRVYLVGVSISFEKNFIGSHSLPPSLVRRIGPSLGLSQVVVVLVVGLESQQVVSLLGVLPLVFNTGMGGVVALRWRGGTIHGSPFVVLVLLQAEKVGFLRVVTEMVFLVVVLVGKMVWCVVTPLSSKWLGSGFTLLVLTQC